MDRVRIGVLGAARITPVALVKPAALVPEVDVAAVAARDPARARAFADRHGIPRVHDSYEALVGDPDVDALYVPLPNSHHARWTLAALEAGKHVLCEKPFTANAAEATEVAAAAARSDLVVMEAFHWRYHPLARRMKELVDGGALGTVRHFEAALCFPLLRRGDIRFRLDLAGGATMDAGCYAIHMVRTLAGAEPQVTRAQARLASPGVDRWMRADLAFPDGRTGRISCSLLSASLLRVGVRVVGDDGELRVFNPISPQYYHRLRLRRRGRTVTEGLGRRSTYEFQLRAFTDAVLHGVPTLTPPSDAVANMRVIDAVYRAAGLRPRGEA